MALLNNMLSVLCFLLALVLHYSAGSLHLKVHPTEISPGLSKALTVNCSFSYAGVSNISSIISLIISKSDARNNQTPNFMELESLNVFTPDKIIGLSQVNATVTGQIDANRESYLSIIWSYPQAEESGLYLCEVHGVDYVGHPVQMSYNALVMSQQPDMEQLINKVSKLQRQVESQETMINNQSQTITRQNTAIEHLERLVQNQSIHNDIQTSEINTLREVAKNQSDTIDLLLALTSKQADSITSMLNFQNFIRKALELEMQKAFYVSSEHEGHRYLLSKDDWNNSDAAGQTCESYGGYLATIVDRDENQFLKDFVGSFSDVSYVLLNGTDEGHEYNWTLTNTDQALPYTDWGSNEPAQSSTTWNCLV